MPMARYEAKVHGRRARSSRISLQARQLRRSPRRGRRVLRTVPSDQDEKLGTRESFVGRFVIDASRVEGERKSMVHLRWTPDEQGSCARRPAFARPRRTHIQKSELCATCHTLYTKALGPEGQVIGELPEQVPYQEWLHSDFGRSRAASPATCRSSRSDMPITSVLGEPRAGMSRHVFVGGNFFMLRMLNRYRGRSERRCAAAGVGGRPRKNHRYLAI